MVSGRKKGYKMSKAQKEAVSKGLRDMYAARKLRKRSKAVSKGMKAYWAKKKIKAKITQPIGAAMKYPNFKSKKNMDNEGYVEIIEW
jgi:hypothetical protein